MPSDVTGNVISFPVDLFSGDEDEDEGEDDEIDDGLDGLESSTLLIQ